MGPLTANKHAPVPPAFRSPRIAASYSLPNVREDEARRSREVDRKKEKKRDKRIRQKRRRAAGSSPNFSSAASSSGESSSSSSLSLEECDERPPRHALSYEEILEQEQKDTERRAQWYKRVLNSPDEPEDIRDLCIELMQLERALDQFDSWQ